MVTCTQPHEVQAKKKKKKNTNPHNFGQLLIVAIPIARQIISYPHQGPHANPPWSREEMSMLETCLIGLV